MEWLVLFAALVVVYLWLEGKPPGSAAKTDPAARERPSTPRVDRARNYKDPAHRSKRSEPIDCEEVLRASSTRGESLVITYVDREGEKTVRRIKPIEIFNYDYGEGLMRCVRAHCFLRNAERTFALFRIKKIEKP
jgi:predicted DNA-binding transcriptional regulator YafY